MYSNLTTRDNNAENSSLSNMSSNDLTNPRAIRLNYSEANQRSQPELLINNISAENDDGEDTILMDTMDMTENVPMPTEHSRQLSMLPASSASSLSSNFPEYRQQNEPSMVIYQPKCASTTTSAQRCRQWQIIGGGFGDGYDVLLPEEEVGVDSEPESDKEDDLEHDLVSFLEQIVSVQVRRAQILDAQRGASSSPLKCTCLRPKCRLNQYLLRNFLTSSKVINNGKIKPGDQQLLSGSHNDASKSPVNAKSEVLSDQCYSNIGSRGSSVMLNTVLKHKNNLNFPPRSKSQEIVRMTTGTQLNSNSLSSPYRLPPHHANQNQGETSSQVIPTWQPHNQTRHIKHRRRSTDQNYSYPIPDLPKLCSNEVREAHADILLRAGGETRVSRLYSELTCLANCFGGWRELLETSPKEGNTLLMWLCCQPLKPEPRERPLSSTYDTNSSLYSKIIVVALAMITETYERDTKDDTEDDKCLLFARNSQEASALDLAALTNKYIITSWLALLYLPLGHDVNETNEQGQSVLHLLARIGDEAADTLQALLKLRSSSTTTSLTTSGHIFRLDIVNGGGKTPLDVAVACTEFYGSKDGITGVEYRRVITHFYEMIMEEANEFEMRMALEKKGNTNSGSNMSINQTI